MRTRFVFIALSLSLFAAACADDMEPGLEGEDDIDSSVASAEGLKGDGLASTATYFFIKRDTRKCAAPMCGGYFVNRVNRSWTKCHDGAWRNACYVASLDTKKTMGLAEDEAQALDSAIFEGSVVVRGDIKPVRVGNVATAQFIPSEAWHAATKNAPAGTFYRVTDKQIVCITTPCASFHEAMLNSTTSQDVHSVSVDAIGANELIVNQFWTDLDKAPVLVVGTNRTYKDELSGRPGVRLEATQAYSKITHTQLTSYVPTAREIGGRDFTNLTGVAPLYPRTYRFDFSSWNVQIDDAVAPCPTGAMCIWSGIVTQTATWAVNGDKIELTFPGSTANGYNIVYYKELAVKHDAQGNLVLAEVRNDGTSNARLFR